MKPGYTIKGFEWKQAGELKPHPAAEMPIDRDDRVCLQRSIAEQQAVFMPLLITAQNEIVDGLNRWREAQASGLTRLPCLIIEAADPAQVVRECLATGRKRTTGQRIMCYLDAHKREVLTAWAANAGKGEIFRKHSKRSNERMAGEKGPAWSADGIAERLQCSHSDVEAGIELLECIEGKRRYDELRGKPGTATAEYLASLDQQRLAVLSGGVGIRRWKAAVAGRDATAGKQRRDPDYALLARKAAATLHNAFLGWAQVSFHSERDRAVFRGWIASLLGSLPPDLHGAAIEGIAEHWPKASLLLLMKAMRGKFKS